MSPVVREAFAAAVRDSLGLVFPPTRAAALDRGIEAVVAALGEPDAAALLDRLTGGDDAVRDALVAELTVGETYLFRDDHHFGFVRDLALPEAVRRGGVVRLWSAGCATGEEAWSLAITAREALGADGARVEVVGTDINPRFLERARRGWYGRWSFRGVDPARRERWFLPDRDGWRVAPELRESVRFAPLNLLDAASPEWPRAVDVIFCRNVAIYFDVETVRRVAARLALSLRPGGWLVPGPSDPLLPAGVGLTATLRGPLVYHREDGVGAALAPSVAGPPAEPAPARRSPLPATRRRPSAAPKMPPRAPDPPAQHRSASERARALADAGDLAGATRVLDAAVALDGLDPALYLLRSTVRQASGDDRGACDDADRAIVIDRSLAFAHLLSAAARARLGDGPASRRALRNARRLLLGAADDAPIPHSEGHGRQGLLALCDRLARTLGDDPASRGQGGERP